LITVNQRAVAAGPRPPKVPIGLGLEAGARVPYWKMKKAKRPSHAS
jgi:hypothetical protein